MVIAIQCTLRLDLKLSQKNAILAKIHPHAMETTMQMARGIVNCLLVEMAITTQRTLQLELKLSQRNVTLAETHPCVMEMLMQMARGIASCLPVVMAITILHMCRLELRLNRSNATPLEIPPHVMEMTMQMEKATVNFLYVAMAITIRPTMSNAIRQLQIQMCPVEPKLAVCVNVLDISMTQSEIANEKALDLDVVNSCLGSIPGVGST